MRSIILTGFPWNLWIYSFSSTVENLQLIDSLGFFSLNLIIITFFFSPDILFLKNSNKYFVFSILVVLFFSNYFYGSYKINASDVGIKSTDSKINFKIVTAGLELSEFKDPTDIALRLIKLSEPQKKKENHLYLARRNFYGWKFFKYKK